MTGSQEIEFSVDQKLNQSARHLEMSRWVVRLVTAEVFVAHVREAAAGAGTRSMGWLRDPVDHPGTAGILELIGLRRSVLRLELMT